MKQAEPREKMGTEIRNISALSCEDYRREVLNKKLCRAFWKFLEYYLQETQVTGTS